MIDRVVPGPRDRIFRTFNRWPLVPTDDLVKLRQSLRQVQELGGPTAAGELLALVDYELHRRAQTPQEEDASRPQSGTAKAPARIGPINPLGVGHIRIPRLIPRCSSPYCAGSPLTGWGP